MRDRCSASLLSARQRALAFLAIAFPACVAAAVELPPLNRGMWEFTATLDGKPEDAQRRCADPRAELRHVPEQLAQQGCKVSPLAREAEAYSYMAECRAEGRIRLTYSVIHVESASSYRVEVVSNDGAKLNKRQMTGKRLGDC